MQDRPFFHATWKDLQREFAGEPLEVLQELALRCGPGRRPSKGCRGLYATLKDTPRAVPEAPEAAVPF